MSQSSRPVLVDTDPGIDDALALFLAWGLPGLRVEAISTVAGNVPVDLATVNVFRILDAARPAHRPRVARGAATPLRRSLVTATHVHGDDGLGNLDRFRGPDGGPRHGSPRLDLEMRDGADLILETADRFGEELIVIALGPLTNVALALRRDPGRLRGIGRLVIMGGAVTVAGNVTPAAEFNFHVDPDAAQAVLEGGLPVELVPLDVTRRVTLGRADLDARLLAPRGPRSQFLEDFTAHGFAFGGTRGDGGITLHDPLAVAVAAFPSLVGLESLHVQVETESELTRGLSLADRRPGAPTDRRAPNCQVALTVDAPRALALTLEGLCRACA
jgi:purine nucleosidase/pyrimidine-specific ribonucleoside hydrolase